MYNFNINKYNIIKYVISISFVHLVFILAQAMLLNEKRYVYFLQSIKKTLLRAKIPLYL